MGKRAKPYYPLALIEAACSDGDRDAIAALSARIVQECRLRREAEKTDAVRSPVRNHGHIPESLAANFVYRMVKARCWSLLPPELALALQVVLKQDVPPPGGHDLRYDDAADILHDEPDISTSELARRVGLPRSSLSGWLKKIRS